MRPGCPMLEKVHLTLFNDTILYRPHRLDMYPFLTTFGIFGAGCWLQLRVNKKTHLLTRKCELALVTMCINDAYYESNCNELQRIITCSCKVDVDTKEIETVLKNPKQQSLQAP